MADQRKTNATVITDPDTSTQQASVDSSGRLQVNNAGDIAHDAADSGNPVKVGLKALTMAADPTEVAAGDRTDWYANTAGIPYIIGGHPNVISHAARNTAAQTNTALITGAAGDFIVVTRISLTVDNSCSVDVDFTVGFHATTLPTPGTGAGTAGILADFMGIPAGGGITIGDGSGILGVSAAGDDLRYTNTIPTGGNCSISVSYFIVNDA